MAVTWSRRIKWGAMIAPAAILTRNMKTNMNTILVITGIALVLTGILRSVINAPPEPLSGAIQIRQEGDKFWLYKYNRHPGWNVYKLTRSLEEARAIKAAEERKPSAEPVVIE